MISALILQHHIHLHIVKMVFPQPRFSTANFMPTLCPGASRRVTTAAETFRGRWSAGATFEVLHVVSSALRGWILNVSGKRFVLGDQHLLRITSQTNSEKRRIKKQTCYLNWPKEFSDMKFEELRIRVTQKLQTKIMVRNLCRRHPFRVAQIPKNVVITCYNSWMSTRYVYKIQRCSLLFFVSLQRS